MHAAPGGLIPGGVPRAITTARADQVLTALRPDGAVEADRCELAAALPGDLRRIDARLRETGKKPAVAVAAAGTSLTRLSGVGPGHRRGRHRRRPRRVPLRQPGPLRRL
jgi:transposase